MKSLKIIVIIIVVLALLLQISFFVFAKADMKRLDRDTNFGENISYSMKLQDSTARLLWSTIEYKVSRLFWKVPEHKEYEIIVNGETLTLGDKWSEQNSKYPFSNIYRIEYGEIETVEISGKEYEIRVKELAEEKIHDIIQIYVYEDDVIYRYELISK